MNICTIVCENYLAQARTIARSFGEFYPDGTCVVLIVDAVNGREWHEPFTVVTLADLNIPDVEVMAGIYEPIEFSTAVKPWLLEWMVSRFGHLGPVAYFDPDISFFSRLPELEEMLSEHWVVLTPHFTRAQPLDDESPSEQAILLAGTYNLGFIALRRHELLPSFLAWWQERLRRGCIVDTASGYFVDQRYVDLVPGLFDDVGILRHDGYNVAYWNLATRRVESGPEGISINGLPLRFFHFSGFDPRVPGEISKHQTRVSMQASPALAAVFTDYADRLVAAGFDETCRIPYGFAESAGGRRLTHSVRRVYRAAVSDGFAGSLFDDGDDAAFAELLRQPDREAGRVPQGYAYLWLATSELQEQFPDPLYNDRARFLNWCVREDTAGRLLGGYVPIPLTTRSQGSRYRPFGVNVVGYLNAESGVGEAARSVVALLDEAGVDVWPVALEAPGLPNQHPFRVPGGVPDLPFRSTLVCVNADMLSQLGPSLSRSGLTQTDVTGLWWWETETFPERFESAFGWVDRVIAGSTFVRDAIARAGHVPVQSVPLPIKVGHVAQAPVDVDWPEGFVFHFSFDFASVYRRKNPDGLVAAYIDAFTQDDGAALVIKSINGDRDPVHRDALKRAVAGRRDILIVDRFLSEAERNWLTAASDCYVSLHRSEGFGLTMAEAMYLGKPVIATGYSGNLDFMTPENSMLVDFSLVSVGEDAAPYDPFERWAEPDLADAATKMRWVFDNPAAAGAIGEKAARSIRTTHSLERGAEALAAILVGDVHG